MTADERIDRTHPQLLTTLHPLLEAPPGPDDDILEVHALLADARRARATDIHLDPDDAGWRIRLRIDGRVLTAQRIDAGQGARLANQFKVLAGLNPVRALTADEGGFSYAFPEAGDDESHLRVSAVSCVAGEKLAIRFLERPRAFADPLALGIGREGVQGIRRWMDATAGMLLVAGPTGAGKTTTLYTLLDELKLSDSHVMTLEDPVEYELAGINQVQVDTSNGLDFASGIRAMLRLDPDYLLIGELRDPESAQAAVGVASSGRSLMSTLHSRDAVGVVSALRHLGVADTQIGANLGLVVAQRLVRRLCEACRERRPISTTDAEWLAAVDLPVPERVWSPVGCAQCDGLGYRGRTGVFEIWQPSPEDQVRILGHADEATLRRALIARGERLMFAAGIAKAEAGITSLREVFRMGAILAA